MKKILNILGNILLTILVILLIGYGWAFVEMKIMLKSNPEMFGYVFFQQKSDDMMTDFYPGDIVIVKKNAEYNPGDRILYLDEDSEYNIQTVVSVDSVSTTTKCNTCSMNNPAIDNSQVIGRVVGKFAFLGKFITFFIQKWVIMTVAILGFTCVIVSQYLKSTPIKRVKKVASDE